RAQAYHASLTPPVLTHLNIPKNYVRTSSDSCDFKIAQKLGCHWSPFSIFPGFAHLLSVIIAINGSRSRCNGALEEGRIKSSTLRAALAPGGGGARRYPLIRRPPGMRLSQYSDR